MEMKKVIISGTIDTAELNNQQNILYLDLCCNEEFYYNNQKVSYDEWYKIFFYGKNAKKYWDMVVKNTDILQDFGSFKINKKAIIEGSLFKKKFTNENGRTWHETCVKGLNLILFDNLAVNNISQQPKETKEQEQIDLTNNLPF